ncbi:hypothetical protein Ahia01_001311000 [Argonauta hians]
MSDDNTGGGGGRWASASKSGNSQAGGGGGAGSGEQGGGGGSEGGGGGGSNMNQQQQQQQQQKSPTSPSSSSPLQLGVSDVAPSERSSGELSVEPPKRPGSKESTRSDGKDSPRSDGKDSSRSEAAAAARAAMAMLGSPSKGGVPSAAERKTRWGSISPKSPKGRKGTTAGLKRPERNLVIVKKRAPLPTGHGDEHDLMNWETPDPVMPMEDELPRPSVEAQVIFEDLQPQDMEQLLFSDQLTTYSGETSLGTYKVHMERAQYQQQNCIKITARSIGTIDGIPCGTALVAYVDHKLHTLEQRLHEYVRLEKFPLDRKTMVVKRDSLYVFHKTIAEGWESYQIKRSWNVSDLPIFILEGANTLLLRHLINKKSILKSFQIPTLDSDGYVCNSEYSNLPPKNVNIANRTVMTFGLKRSLQSEMDSPINWMYYFMTDAHLINRTQGGSHVRMQVTAIPSSESDENPKFKKQPIDIDQDHEMKSKLIDRKDKFMNDFSVYLRRNPEIRALLADFLQYLLLEKPDDVVRFAAEYFSPFSIHLTPPPTFYSTRNNTLALNADLFDKL